MAIEYLDGSRYRRAVVAGADWVLHTRETLDRINVYPVPDGDTGTNMALSLTATSTAVRDLRIRHLGAVAEQVAEAAIVGAKGNSGLILAHWFLGVSEGLGQRPRASATELAEAMARGTASVYDALDDPVEGTILTVMRAAADAASAAASGGDLRPVLDEVIEHTEATLERTPEMLAVLEKAGVVDAGGLGFVNFLKGVRRALRGEPPPEYSQVDLHLRFPHPAPDPGEELADRFCTEVVCRGTGFVADRLRKQFADDGSDLLVATTGKVFHLHVHTNDPHRVFEKAARLGTVEERKVEDMVRQREERGASAQQVIADQPDTVAVVCDSTCDLPDDVREKYGIEIVPLQVLFEGRVYRDRIDLSTREFYRRMAAGAKPTTSQPPPREFVQALEKIRPDREVVIMTMSSKLSGTYRSAKSVTPLAGQIRVAVVDSGTTSLGLGLQALGVARLARSGASLEDICSRLRRWREGTGAVFTVATLEYLRRGGRIGAAQSLVGNLLGLRPVLTLIDGVVSPVGKARGDRGAFDAVFAELEHHLPRGTPARFGVVEADGAEIADEAEERLRESHEVVELLRGEFTGVVGAHTGPGTWALVWQEVHPDDPLPEDSS